MKRVCPQANGSRVNHRTGWIARASTIALILLTGVISPALAEQHDASSTALMATQGQALITQGRELYEAGRYREAIAPLQQAVQIYRAAGDALREGLTLSNLSLVYQQLGQWSEAQGAIATSLTLLQSEPNDIASQRVFAQALDIQGRLHFAQGQAELALTTWQQATDLYQHVGDQGSALESQINQAQALQTLGLYRRAITLLTSINQTLQTQPDSLTKAVALRSLGDALQVAGNLDAAQQSLEQSLRVAQGLREEAGASAQVREAIGSAYLSLGNVSRSAASATLSQNNLLAREAIARLTTPLDLGANPTQRVIERQRLNTAQAFWQQSQAALTSYQQAADEATHLNTQVQAQLNQLSLLVELEEWSAARELARQLNPQLDQLPPSRTSIYNQIDYAQSLLNALDSEPLASLPEIAQRLAVVSQQAALIGDTRAQSYALGTLGGVYEKTEQWLDAQRLTQQALSLSQAIDAADISYRWQWQLGRLLKTRQDKAGAIAAYSQAVKTLQTLRGDLVAINRDVQFSFRESVEPVYRELVGLLLETENNAAISEASLAQARDVIEGLQIAELDNFFREACLDTAFQLDRVIDQANLPSAVFYTILLPDRLEVVLKLPRRDLIHYSVPVSQAQVESTADELLAELKRPYTSRSLETLSQQVYDWLIRPAESVLTESDIDTLVFVLDGSLRNIPMAALFDGKSYLIENYSVALAPGLQLPDPRPLQGQQFRALVAGLSEARSDFPPLNFVEKEVEEIQSDIPSRVLLNQTFTRQNFQSQLSASPYTIVHIATHGQFSSNAADTFILAWDDPINVNELSEVLQSKGLDNSEPIELLVLSACRTAAGDRRATLGLAGVAVRAGARSTIASLWNVDDESGALMMREFYRELSSNSVTKAEALRRAQRSLLARPEYRAPRFWAPYVLLGNWL